MGIEPYASVARVPRFGLSNWLSLMSCVRPDAHVPHVLPNASVDPTNGCSSPTGNDVMSAGWYYMASGWLNKSRRVGPINEADLLAQIDKGKISPETLVQSSKTKGKWVPMNTIGPAMKRWRESHPEDE